MNETCELPDCDKPRYQKRSMCASHFMKQYRYGDPYFKQVIKHTDLTGQRFGSLTAISWSKNRWTCRCDCGATTTARTGDLNRGTVKSCGNQAIHWRSTELGYAAMHQRLRTDRGPATRHRCVDCNNPAEQWSYDHADPDERTEDGMPYSLQVEHYQARCVRCHKRFDLAQLQSSGWSNPTRGVKRGPLDRYYPRPSYSGH